MGRVEDESLRRAIKFMEEAVSDLTIHLNTFKCF